MGFFNRNHLFRLMLAAIFLVPLVPMYITPALFVPVIIFYLLYTRNNPDAYARMRRSLAEIRRSRFSLAFMLLAVWSLVSVVYSDDKVMSLAGAAIYASAFAAFFILKFELNRPFHTKMVLRTYIASVVVVSLYHVSQLVFFAFFSPKPFVRTEHTSFIEHGNILACYMLIALFPMVVMAVRTRKKNLRLAAWYAFVSCLITGSIFLTGSRAGMLGVFLGILTLAFYSSRKFLVVLIPASFMLMVVPYSRNRILDIFSYEQNYSRLRIWKAALYMAKEHPILGIGLNSFFHEYPGYVARFPELNNPYDNNVVYHAHNALFNIQAELGIPGMVLLILMLVAMYRSLVRYLGSDKVWKDYLAFYSGFAVSMIVFVFLNLIDNYSLTPKIICTIAILAGSMHGDARNKGMLHF